MYEELSTKEWVVQPEGGLSRQRASDALESVASIRDGMVMRQGSAAAATRRTLEAMGAAAPECAFNNVKILSRSIEKIYDDAFKPAGLNASQVALLWTILRTEPISSKDVARIMRADQTTVSRIVARAHHRGLLKVGKANADRRQKVIELSAQGRARLAAVFPLWKNAQVVIQSMFEPQALHVLVKRLRSGATPSAGPAMRVRRASAARSASSRNAPKRTLRAPPFAGVRTRGARRQPTI